jgi:hypothetical protein
MVPRMENNIDQYLLTWNAANIMHIAENTLNELTNSDLIYNNNWV